MRRRRDHDAGAPASIEAFASERIEANPGAGDADDDLHVLGALDERTRNLLGLGGVEFRRFAQNASTVTPSQPTSA
jgi:hypothetical protein